MKHLLSATTKFLFVTLLCLSIISCKSKMESAIDDMTSFVNKWEKKTANGKMLTDADKKEFKDDAIDLNNKYKDLQSKASELTAEQQKTVMALGERLTKLMLKSDIIDFH